MSGIVNLHLCNNKLAQPVNTLSMDNTGNINIVEEFKRLLALNGSLEARLDEYAKIIKGRDNEIEMLQSMLTESSAYRSNLDSQVNELNELQDGIAQLRQQVAGSSYIGASKNTYSGNSMGLQQQLEEMKMQYAYLQSQMTDLQKQLIELNNRNLLLQQQTGRIAELESMLENAAEEIEQLKSNQHNNPE